MRILAILCIISILALSVSAGGRTNYIDRVCQRNGFDYGIEKYAWSGQSWIPFSKDNPDWEISIDGDRKSLEWKSTPEVEGVLAYERGGYIQHDGGSSGLIEKEKRGMYFLIFCGNEPEVPEFGIIGAALASVAVMGFVFSRKN